ESGAKVMADLLGEPFQPNELRTLEKGKQACVRAFDGKARLELDYPSFMWNGAATDRGTIEEKQSKAAAHQKFMELLARDHKTAEEADEEIRSFLGYESHQKVVSINEAKTEAAASLDSTALEANQNRKR